MQTRKLFFIFSILLLATACSIPNGISGPTVKPPVPASGTVLMQDDFSNMLSGWDHISMAGSTMDYDSGVYRIVVSAPDFNFWSTPGKQYTDTRIEVDTAKLGGPDANRAGIVCRLNGEQFYFFVISSDGYFAVGRTNGPQSTLLGQDQMTFSANIRTGMAVNHLRADCTGDILAFYVNGFPVAQVIDPTLTSGEVGLIAGAFEQGGVDVIFDQFIVMQP
jgi:hypothetical protein